ncbi:MAG TPA: hypothetical protein VG758_29790 [Hyphomicrobiaceae bacterium]|jgi:hypothetical protein|nr:hypothetical protein [Hyphomicrobiaceae bacterium]
MKTHSLIVGAKRLEGEIVVPERAVGLVIFAHGSGSSRTRPRHSRVARQSAPVACCSIS